jgi:glycosyltransferase involved in cell wall biosynthesis
VIRTNIHLFNSPFKNESRAIKEANALIDLGLVDKVIFFVNWESGLKQNEFVNSQIQIIRQKQLFYNYNKRNVVHKIIVLLRLISYPIIVVRNCYKYKVSFINCHNADLLPGAVLLKLFSNAKLIYVPHELERHRMGVSSNFIGKVISTLSEILCIRFCDNIIVVGELIAEWYKKKYSLKNILIIRNTPVLIDQISNKRKSIFRDKFSIKDESIIFIYQGVLSKGRSIELYLDVFKKLDLQYHIIFMGYGEQEALIIEHANEYENIHFHEAVKPSEILNYTIGADVGLCVIENKCLSYYYCLPNKFFEYIHSGIPVIASNFPEMKLYTDKYNCGWLIEPSNPVELLDTIKKINRDSLNLKSIKLRDCANDFNWQNESKKYIKAYEF